MTTELVDRGAALAFRDGGSAIGAALHGSRHCQHPEGGPSMAIIDEIPRSPTPRSFGCCSRLGRRSRTGSARTALAVQC